ncbi:MAG: TrkA family potassium uptake protein [Candidatus Hydrogenedentota bacterium]|nr:MAG: TrkA family potassium uptake protein [Candidatus Hydrogenedentota bacterium]
MYIVIAGGGLIGRGLAQRLANQKHEVVVIDQNPDVCEDIYAKFGAITINGNSTDIEILESAGIDHCDIAVATMKDDSDNLAFALLAKHYNVKQIIVKMNDEKYERIYKTVGVKNISRGTELLIDQILLSIESPELRTIISLGNIEISVFIIPSKAACVGETVAEVVNQRGFPRELIITCVYDDNLDSFSVPRGDTVLNAHDRVFLCGSRKNMEKAVKFLK